MVKNTPPMGWNTWNTFGNDINEQLIFEMADEMVNSGMRDCGYEYLVIDDCWSKKQRDENGRLEADPEKFPHGMKAVADYVHSKGLKFGMYSCAGTLTCAGYPGSYDHEFVDAATFAEWGVDFLKYDYCFHSSVIHGKYLYRRMGIALENCGRDILFSACSWGADNTHEWIRETGASMWRSTGDIFDKWDSVTDLLGQQNAILPYGGTGCFNDMDMLIVGMYGKGNVGLSGCDDVQYKSHFSMWSLFGSPLMIGGDLRHLSDSAKKILTNRELIRLDQDAACRQVIKLDGVNRGPNTALYQKLLANGDIALGFFNLSDTRTGVALTTDEIGLPCSTGKTLEMHDLWSGNVETIRNETFLKELEPFDCALYRCKVVDL